MIQQAKDNGVIQSRKLSAQSDEVGNHAQNQQYDTSFAEASTSRSTSTTFLPRTRCTYVGFGENVRCVNNVSANNLLCVEHQRKANITQHMHEAIKLKRGEGISDAQLKLFRGYKPTYTSTSELNTYGIIKTIESGYLLDVEKKSYNVIEDLETLARQPPVFSDNHHSMHHSTIMPRKQLHMQFREMQLRLKKSANRMAALAAKKIDYETKEFHRKLSGILGIKTITPTVLEAIQNEMMPDIPMPGDYELSTKPPTMAEQIRDAKYIKALNDYDKIPDYAHVFYYDQLDECNADILERPEACMTLGQCSYGRIMPALTDRPSYIRQVSLDKYDHYVEEAHRQLMLEQHSKKKVFTDKDQVNWVVPSTPPKFKKRRLTEDATSDEATIGSDQQQQSDLKTEEQEEKPQVEKPSPCPNPALPYAIYCSQHILLEPNQHLFMQCSVSDVVAGHNPCRNVVFPLRDNLASSHGEDGDFLPIGVTFCPLHEVYGEQALFEFKGNRVGELYKQIEKNKERTKFAQLVVEKEKKAMANIHRIVTDVVTDVKSASYEQQCQSMVLPTPNRTPSDYSLATSQDDSPIKLQGM